MRIVRSGFLLTRRVLSTGFSPPDSLAATNISLLQEVPADLGRHLGHQREAGQEGALYESLPSVQSPPEPPETLLSHRLYQQQHQHQQDELLDLLGGERAGDWSQRGQ